MAEKQKIGILGGTFNPIHYGHLRFAEAVMEAENLSRIIFVPAFAPPLKNSGVVPYKDRVNMLNLAIQDNRRFWFSQVEERLPAPSYTYTTIAEMVKRSPKREYVFITGFGSWLEMGRWHRPFDLLGLCDFIFVSDRCGVDEEVVEFDGPQQVIEKLEKLPTNAYNPQIAYKHPSGTLIRFIAVPTPHIRSTDIRCLREDNRSIRYLVPEKVRDYIEENKLYLPKK
jgi:nicotinate-nucleotide adenylyltransferase